MAQQLSFKKTSAQFPASNLQGSELLLTLNSSSRGTPKPLRAASTHMVDSFTLTQRHKHKHALLLYRTQNIFIHSNNLTFLVLL